MSEHNAAQALMQWLEENPGQPPPDEVSPDVVEAVYALRPDLAPVHRVSFDDVLAQVRTGPLTQDAPQAPSDKVVFLRSWKTWAPALAAAAALVVVWPIADKAEVGPPPESTAPQLQMESAPESDVETISGQADWVPTAPKRLETAPTEVPKASRTEPVPNQGASEPQALDPIDDDPVVQIANETVAQLEVVEELEAMSQPAALQALDGSIGSGMFSGAAGGQPPSPIPQHATTSEAKEELATARGIRRRTFARSADEPGGTGTLRSQAWALPEVPEPRDPGIIRALNQPESASELNALLRHEDPAVAMEAAYHLAQHALDRGNTDNALATIAVGLGSSRDQSMWRARLLALQGDTLQAQGDMDGARRSWVLSLEAKDGHP